MINSYVRFDSVKFLKESRDWKKQRDLLKAELDSIPLVASIDTTEQGKTANHQSPVEAAAVRRERIAKQIAYIDSLEKTKRLVLGKLSDEQLNIINGFFFGEVKISVFVRKYSEEHYICISEVYKLRRETLEIVTELLEGYL